MTARPCALERSLVADRRWRWTAGGFTAERRLDAALDTPDTAAVCGALLHAEIVEGCQGVDFTLALSQKGNLSVLWLSLGGGPPFPLASGLGLDSLGRVVAEALARVWTHGLPWRGVGDA